MSKRTVHTRIMHICLENIKDAFVWCTFTKYLKKNHMWLLNDKELENDTDGYIDWTWASLSSGSVWTITCRTACIII